MSIFDICAKGLEGLIPSIVILAYLPWTLGGRPYLSKDEVLPLVKDLTSLKTSESEISRRLPREPSAKKKIPEHQEASNFVRFVHYRRVKSQDSTFNTLDLWLH